MPAYGDLRPVLTYYQASTLSMIVWDGSLQAGTLTIGAVNQGTPAATANRWPTQITDGTNLATVTAGGALNVTGGGSSAAVGTTAAAVPGSADYQGNRGTTALPTAVTDGQLVGNMADKFGRTVALLGTIRDLRASQRTAINNSTAETTIITAGAAGIFNDLVALVIANRSGATNLTVDIRDVTAGAIILSIQSPANTTQVVAWPGAAWPQTTAASAWTAQLDALSANDLVIAALFEKNK